MSVIGSLPLTALLLCCCGLGAARFSWRRHSTLGRLALTAAGVLLSAGIYTSVQAWGTEFGISYALAAINLIALVLIGQNRERRPGTPHKSHTEPKAGSSTAQKWLTFTVAGPLAGLASGQLTLLAARLLPGSEVSNMATAALIFPVFWGCLAYVTCMADSPLKPAIVMCVTALTCSLALYV